jgi:hypothetical protein
VFIKAVILSNILDPKLKGKLFSPETVANAKVTMMHLLRDKEEFKVFSKYLKGEGLFADECMIGQDSDIVWYIAAQSAPKLSSIAIVSYFSCEIIINFETNIIIPDSQLYARIYFRGN